jgi:hypothetical protein
MEKPPLAVPTVNVSLALELDTISFVLIVPVLFTPTFWLASIVAAVVGVEPVLSTNVPVVSAVTTYAVVDVVDALIVDMRFPLDGHPALTAGNSDGHAAAN